MKTRLTSHFTLEELCVTNTHLSNEPTDKVKIQLFILAVKVLEPARMALNRPITVNSGYRSILVNRAVSKAKNSQHLTGNAADIECSNNRLLFDWLSDNADFDQLIWEGGTTLSPAWVHVSYVGQNNRRQIIYNHRAH